MEIRDVNESEFLQKVAKKTKLSIHQVQHLRHLALAKDMRLDELVAFFNRKSTQILHQQYRKKKYEAQGKLYDHNNFRNQPKEYYLEIIEYLLKVPDQKTLEKTLANPKDSLPLRNKIRKVLDSAFTLPDDKFRSMNSKSLIFTNQIMKLIKEDQKKEGGE